MTEAELLDIRTVCRFCNDGKRWRYLGSHLAQIHGITAREYKQEIGVYLKIPLTDPDLESLQKKRTAERLNVPRFLATGAPTRFNPGESRPRYVSRQFRETLAMRNRTRDRSRDGSKALKGAD